MLSRQEATNSWLASIETMKTLVHTCRTKSL